MKSFYHYLLKYRHPKPKDSISEFANQAYEDHSFPKTSTDYHEISSYLELNADYLHTMATFDEASFLIEALEKEMAGEDIVHVFSLARASSFGMNAVLYHSGYQYGGRLINNCFIAEGLENMNIWCKQL